MSEVISPQRGGSGGATSGSPNMASASTQQPMGRRDAQADVAVAVRGDRPAGHDPLSGDYDVVDQVFVHDVPHRGQAVQSVTRTGRPARIL